MRNFYISKDIMNKLKDKLQNERKYLENIYVTRVWYPEYSNKFLQLNETTKKNPLRKWTKHLASVAQWIEC